MIAHADSLAGGFGKAWLTGYDARAWADLLADNGIPLVPIRVRHKASSHAATMRPFAPLGHSSALDVVVQHARTPYHHPKDEASTIDAPHMAAVISATARALRLLADGERPTWHPGGKP
jgi:hypothetical protein